MFIEQVQNMYISSKAPVPIPNTLVSVRCVGYCRVFVGVTNYMWDTLGFFYRVTTTILTYIQIFIEILVVVQ